MKNILLTSTALVAFAGAAAAGGHTSVSFSGAASAEYNSVSGYATDADLDATMSADLDNGLNVSVTIGIDTANFKGEPTKSGSVVLSSDTASLSFGTAVVGAVRTAVGKDYKIGTGNDTLIVDGEIAGVAASATFGATTLLLSAALTEADTTVDNIEVGVTTSAAGWDLGFGLVNSTSEYAMTAAGTAGGATVGFGMSNVGAGEWDVSLAYPVGAVTVSASTDEANAWEVGAAFAADGVSAGIVLSPNSVWKITAGYAADGITVAAEFTDASVMTLGATFDMGNSLTVGAGIENTENYAFASYDLGGGANAFVDYSNAAAKLVEVGPSERDIAVGTTVGVSFTF